MLDYEFIASLVYGIIVARHHIAFDITIGNNMSSIYRQRGIPSQSMIFMNAWIVTFIFMIFFPFIQ